MEDTSAFAKAQTKKIKCAIGFYNLENLFDTKNDPATLDDDFTPGGFKEWNSYKFDKKVKKLAKVISKIGKKETAASPSLLGVAEVENKAVLEALIKTSKLDDEGYSIVHYDSPDERGIDVALLYKKKDFTVHKSEAVTLYLETEEGDRDYTRDILYVQGNLLGTEVHILVNHWPSRRRGANETSHKRIKAAQKNRELIDNLVAQNPEARVIIMGDFNDGPHSESIKKHLVKTDFYNPMLYLGTRYEGSLNYNYEWFIFDQIIFSNNFVRIYHNDLPYEKSDIYNDFYLTEYDGKFKGNPFRTYAGKNYLGGYSDHFPVYTILTAIVKN